MKNRKFILNKNEKYSIQYDSNSYLWFRYHNLFFHSIMNKGRKLLAFNFLSDLKYNLKIREGVEPFWIFLIAFMNLTPEVLLFTRRRGSKFFSIPYPITERKQYTYAIKWVVKILRSKYRTLKLDILAETLIKAIYNGGIAFEQKVAVHNLANANVQFFRFFKR